jgi:type I restriction enzyme R subunit/putative DNA methylase
VQAPAARGWYSRGYLPHFDAAGLIQHITFHLADSLPREAIARMQHELESFTERQRAVEQRKRIQELLDSGLGSCILCREDCARIVEDSLLFGDGDRYRLLAWVVMPNHVHVLIQQLPDWPLGKVVQSWKRHTTREIRHLPSPDNLGSLGPPSCTRQPSAPVWQRDYWDRFIRDERHFLAAKLYIENNPVAAGLVPKAEAWPWGSARFVEAPSETRRSRERAQEVNDV